MTDYMACGCPRCGHASSCPYNGDLQAQLEASINGAGVKVIPVGYLLEAGEEGDIVPVRLRMTGAVTLTLAPHEDQSEISRMRRRKAGRCPTHDLQPEAYGVVVATGKKLSRCPHAGCEFEVMT